MKKDDFLALAGMAALFLFGRRKSNRGNSTQNLQGIGVVEKTDPQKVYKKFVDDSLNKKEYHEKFELDLSNNAKLWFFIIFGGIPEKAYISADQIRHMRKRHMDPEVEEEGYLLSKDDLYRIPERINNCTRMGKSKNETKQKKEDERGIRISFESKEIEKKITIFGVEIKLDEIVTSTGEKKFDISIHSMWKEDKDKNKR